MSDDNPTTSTSENQALATSEQVFHFNNLSLHTIQGDDGEPWFLAKDVAVLTGHDSVANMVRMCPDDEKGLHKVKTLGGSQEVTFISEPGLYRVILGSRQDNAERLKKWVVSEVLPSIRKTGQYSVQPDVVEEEALSEKMLEAAALKLVTYDVELDQREELIEAKERDQAMRSIRHAFELKKAYQAMLLIRQAWEKMQEIDKSLFENFDEKVALESLRKLSKSTAEK